MEATKRTYQKHTVGGKISIKYVSHYHNNNDKKISLYVQLTVKRQTTKFKSKINVSGEDMTFFLEDNLFKSSIKREFDLIHFLLSKLKPFENDNFDIKDFFKLYNRNDIDLTIAFDSFLRKSMRLNSKNNNSLLRLKPIVFALYFQDKYPHLNEIFTIFTSKIWYLDVLVEEYMQVFNDKFLNEKDIPNYDFLYPTIHDFVSGEFQKSLNYFMNNEDSTKLIEDMNKLYNLFEKDYWQ